MSKKTIEVGYLARVEGEGSLYVRTEGAEVKDVQLKIFEPPRFFEAFLRGRSYHEAPDITARICGICPIAYQMSTVHAIENAFGLTMPEHIRQLRRLLYCGEWIESHTLHLMLLHAPDFLGLPDALALARDHRALFEKGLRVKKAGNALLTILGGRSVHPINVRVGGFYRLPDRRELDAFRSELEWGREATAELLDWVSGFDFPEISLDYEFVCLQHPSDYPFNEGAIVSNRGLNIAQNEYDRHFTEVQVPHSTALQSERVGGASYLTGPLARFALNFDRLTPAVKAAARRVGLDGPCTNAYRSIQVRALEVLYAFEEALGILEHYDGDAPPSIPVTPRAGMGYAATEAPRGTLYHRYRIADDGTIEDARIVPPTSQNQRRIEDDLREVVTRSIELPEDELKSLCEQTIRNYDPCISCATHFLKLTVDRA